MISALKREHEKVIPENLQASPSTRALVSQLKKIHGFS
jgi:hypothetical protein